MFLINACISSLSEGILNAYLKGQFRKDSDVNAHVA